MQRAWLTFWLWGCSLLLVGGVTQAVLAVEVPKVTGSPRLDVDLYMLDKDRSKVLFQLQEEERQEKGLQELIASVEALIPYYPTLAEPRIFAATLWLDLAELREDIGDDALFKAAEKWLSEAERINRNAWEGRYYQQLGRYYALAPGGWFGPGDAGKAQDYLHHALRVNPNLRETYYIYGVLLIREGAYTRAIAMLEHGKRLTKDKRREVGEKGLDRLIDDAIEQAYVKQGLWREE